jgi:hypothetical protein
MSTTNRIAALGSRVTISGWTAVQRPSDLTDEGAERGLQTVQPGQRPELKISLQQRPR